MKKKVENNIKYEFKFCPEKNKLVMYKTEYSNNNNTKSHGNTKTDELLDDYFDYDLLMEDD